MLENMLCDTCQNLPKCDHCGKLLVDGGNLHARAELPPVSMSVEQAPIPQPDEDKVQIYSQKKSAQIKPNYGMEGILKSVLDKTEGWGLMK